MILGLLVLVLVHSKATPARGRAVASRATLEAARRLSAGRGPSSPEGQFLTAFVTAPRIAKTTAMTTGAKSTAMPPRRAARAVPRR